MPKFIVDRKDLERFEFQTLMASGGGRRLWVCVKEGEISYRAEYTYSSNHKSEVIIKTQSLGEAVRAFNEA